MRASGLWNCRSGRVKPISALSPVWPTASLTISRPRTARPAQGCADRSGVATPCALAGLSPDNGNVSRKAGGGGSTVSFSTSSACRDTTP